SVRAVPVRLEVLPQEGRGNVAHGVGGEEPPAGVRQHDGVEVGSEDLEGDVGVARPERLPDQEREGVGFVAGGAGGTPEADAPLAPPEPLLDQLGQQMPDEEGVLVGVAEELRLVDGDRVEEGVRLGAGAGTAQEGEVRLEVGQAEGGEAAAEAVFEEVALVVAEVEARSLVDEGAELVEGGVGEAGRPAGRSREVEPVEQAHPGTSSEGAGPAARTASSAAAATAGSGSRSPAWRTTASSGCPRRAHSVSTAILVSASSAPKRASRN